MATWREGQRETIGRVSDPLHPTEHRLTVQHRERFEETSEGEVREAVWSEPIRHSYARAGAPEVVEFGYLTPQQYKPNM